MRRISPYLSYLVYPTSFVVENLLQRTRATAVVQTVVEVLSISVINPVHPIHPIFSIPIHQIRPVLDDVSIASSVCTYIIHIYIYIYKLYSYILSIIFFRYIHLSIFLIREIFYIDWVSQITIYLFLFWKNLSICRVDPSDPYGPCCLTNQYIHLLLTSENLSAPIYPSH